MNAGTLQGEIGKVCPVLSCKVLNSTDRSTWSFTPGQGATQAQIDAGNNVIATIPTQGKGACATMDFIERFTDAEYVLLQKERIEDSIANEVGISKLWDMVVCQDIVNLNKPHVQSLKAALVADSILTQARADVIFGMNEGLSQMYI